MKATLSSACILVLVLGLSLCFAVPRQTEAALAAPYTDVIGEINIDTTWSLAGSPYVVVGDVTVMPGVTLTIEPGVQVRFNGNYALGVRGTLIAEGLAGQEILFTSNLASPAPGDWGVLDFRSDSRYSHVQHAIIEYGGNAYKPGAYCATGAVCVNTSSFVMEDSIVRHSPTRGVSLAQSSATLANNAFEHITWEAIRLHACDLNLGECHPTIVGNDFSYTQYPILHVAPLNPVLSGNTATDNQINGYVFYVTCNVAGNNTWYASDLPYVIPPAGGWCLMGVYNRPTTVNIQPGTIVKLENSLQFHYTTVVTATGTAEAPVIFTSLKDDSVGGDTNNDGAASSPAKRDWGMIDHFGDQVRGVYEHAIFRYGGGYPAAFGPTVNSDSGATVSVRQSQISQSGGAGAHAYNASNLTLVENEIFDHRDTCIEVATTTGSVLIENNRIQGCPSGVLVTKGSPTIRGNFFEGNGVGVEVVNTFQAAPVVSPHNRFVGAGQMGIKNRYPLDGCIDARRNWWGDVSGPADTSTATDACGTLDNPEGAGAAVSDGVDYYPWEGNLPRPIIANPGCGVTARDQPVFSGRAAEGATVSFYDNGVLLGQTIAAADDSFTWSPPVPLLDGEHSLSAVAELEGETSLPTPLLPLEVYSELPFDPMGVLISYDLHGHQYTQRMRDENGCATLEGSLEMPVWVRPGTDFTVSVPMRSEFLPAASEGSSQAPAASLPVALPVQPEADKPEAPLADVEVKIHNSNSQGANVVCAASLTGETMYSDFSNCVWLNTREISDTQKIILPANQYDFLFFSGSTNIVDRQQQYIDPSNTNLDIANNVQQGLTIYNESGKDFTEMYYNGTDGQFIGGDFIVDDNAIKNGESLGFKLPYLQADATLVMRDSDGAYYIRYSLPFSIPGNPPLDVISFNKPSTSVTVDYGGEKSICYFNVISHNDLPYVKKLPRDIARRRAVDILELTGQAVIVKGESFTFKLESGSYYIAAYDCLGDLLAEWANVEVTGLSKVLNITESCIPPGTVKVGEGGLRSTLEGVDLQCEAPVDGFSTCSASSPVSASEVTLDICYQPPEDEEPTGWELGVGALTIDPDGYVYNADLGISSKVSGATVTCQVFDEDYQAWSEWPAAFYENQLNPQVTASDGYYAFFVPPGLYRVTASAPGYAGHTSSDIQVVSEIVHYNIPLEPTGSPPSGAIYLPLIIH